MKRIFFITIAILITSILLVYPSNMLADDDGGTPSARGGGVSGTSDRPPTSPSGPQKTKIKLSAPIREGEDLELPPYDPGQGMYTLRIVETYLALIYPYAAALIASLAVIMVIIGGIQIATAGGDTSGVSAGKDRITYAIAGLVLLLLASLVLWTINPNFFSFQPSRETPQTPSSLEAPANNSS